MNKLCVIVVVCGGLALASRAAQSCEVATAPSIAFAPAFISPVVVAATPVAVANDVVAIDSFACAPARVRVLSSPVVVRRRVFRPVRFALRTARAAVRVLVR